MDFELVDGNKFFKVAWHNTSHGMKLMFLIKVVSLLLKTQEAKPKPQSLPKKAPPFVLSGGPALSLPRVRPAPDKAYPCFGAEGRWCDRAERPVRKRTFLLLPAGRPAPPAQ